MSKWNVHYSVRLAYDVKVEADSYESAIKKANNIYDETELNDMEWIDDYVEGWQLDE